MNVFEQQEKEYKEKLKQDKIANRKTIIIVVSFMAIIIGAYILFMNWDWNRREFNDTYCTVTYKIYYPNNTVTKYKTVYYTENQGLPRIKSRRGSNKLIYRGSTLEQTTAPIEIISYNYSTRNYKGRKNR